MQNPNLPFSWVNQTRRNHALEHATLQILAPRVPGRRLAGYSGPAGFWVIGDVPIQLLNDASAEALNRLNAGESRLAIHPNCGTNFATSGLLAGGAAWLSMLGAGRGWRQKLDRLPLVVALTTIALMLAQPIGLKVQQNITTLPRLANLKVSSIQCLRETSPAVHRVLTRQEE